MKQTQETRSRNTRLSTFENFQSKMPTVGGISLPEIAILGAAGFVLWRNRDKIVSFLEENGIDSPSFLSADLSDLIRQGAGAAIASSGSNTPSVSGSRSRRQDA